MIASSSLSEVDSEKEDQVSPMLGSRLHGKSFALSPVLCQPSVLSHGSRGRCGSFPLNLPSNNSPEKSPRKSTISRPQNAIRNYSSFSIIGTINGITKNHNQDDYLIMPQFCDRDTRHLFGVFDGNGEFGHMVSSYIKEKLPYNLEVILDTETNMSNALKQAFLQTNEELLQLENVNFNSSGSTGIIVLLEGNSLFCAYLGDSKAILGRKEGNKIKPIQMTREHKPSLPEEKSRIESCGGRVEPILDENGNRNGQDRVWFKYEKFPGLAFSRNFGHKASTRIGIVAEPEVYVYELDVEDEYIIIGTDGLWEFIPNDEALQLMQNFISSSELEKSAENLCFESYRRWKANTSHSDDITAVILDISAK
ncbi:unnamed protein product [Blepharisma stoltei]|uniref:PPM-type phosphatase domain-containing protein n=1 Tax=Blepharisma stoltei TaxID=1481888 RepID=A0AAU9KJ83_9CILI|nr:unnamed protein product [Blepharisma stoltei]